MSLLSRLFGGTAVSADDSEATLRYLVQLNALRARQDDEASHYNATLAKFGGALTPGSDGLRQVADAARRMADVNRGIVTRHQALGPIPDVAGPCYFAWSNAWLRLDEWSTRAAAAYEGMYEGATPPADAIPGLLVEEEKARQTATKEEASLLRHLKLSAEEARKLIEDGERAARRD